MPNINDIKKTSKSFKKREYRSWNIDGQDKAEAVVNTPPSQNTPSPSKLNEAIIEVMPSKIKKWQFKDRPDNELGDITALADEFKSIGQQQPCIVRPLPSDSQYDYELLIGERRWRAALLAGIALKVIVSKMGDTDAALAQAAENESRKDLSDYAKGMSFSNLIDHGVLKQKDLIEKLGKSKQYVSALLSFSKIPPELTQAIGDMSKVSARTSETIVRLSRDGEQSMQALISLAPIIEKGMLGNKTLPARIAKLLSDKDLKKNTNRKILSRDGRHMFTWRTDNNALPSIHFPKQINSLFEKEKINMEELTQDLLTVLEEKLNKL